MEQMRQMIAAQHEALEEKEVLNCQQAERTRLHERLLADQSEQLAQQAS